MLNNSIDDIEEKYYADQEDAFAMKKLLPPGVAKEEQKAKEKEEAEKRAAEKGESVEQQQEAEQAKPKANPNNRRKGNRRK